MRASAISRNLRPLRHGGIVRREDGAAALEMAVSMTALMMAIIGLMKICLAVYSYHYTSEAAREGVRWAIVRGSTCGTTYSTACPASTNDIATYIKTLGYPALNPANMTVTTSYAPFPSTVTCTPSSACNNAGNMITITVQYAYPLSIPFLPTQTLTMSSTAAAIISQ